MERLGKTGTTGEAVEEARRGKEFEEKKANGGEKLGKCLLFIGKK